MEIEITHLFNETFNPRKFSNSIANSGITNIWQVTWENAKEAKELHLLNSEIEIQDAIDFFGGFGAWSKEELEAMPNDEINALLLQYISGDINEMPRLDNGNIDWKAYEIEASEGKISGNIFKGNDGKVYFYMGS